MHARKLVPYLEDLALTPVEVSDIDKARLSFDDDDVEGSPKRTKAAPKRKRGRPRKAPLE